MQKSEKPEYQILVVDDEPSVRRSITMLLEHDRHHVQSVDSGESALAIFEPGRFDLVMTDYSMHDMNGSQLVALIKERAPGQRIIMATAFADDLRGFGELTAQADLVLNKPFSLSDLREAIASVLAVRLQ
ncbi:MAG TPA: response regulator [Verrucomicrobiae bacterium]|nr:response regulator [Verrucomicrobiae bacterium]